MHATDWERSMMEDPSFRAGAELACRVLAGETAKVALRGLSRPSMGDTVLTLDGLQVIVCCVTGEDPIGPGWFVVTAGEGDVSMRVEWIRGRWREAMQSRRPWWERLAGIAWTSAERDHWRAVAARAP